MSDLVSQNLNMIFKSPKGETVHALKDLNFTIKKGELLTVLGPSGCGKTTLLNIAAGFIRPTSGTITLGNNEINGPGVDRGMVFQQGALFEWLTVAENVNFGLRMKKEDPNTTQKKVDEWLDIVGLKGFGNTPTYQLSGGMQQRVALARCLINDPDLISQNLNMIFKSPKGEKVHALKDINFTLKKGELLTVLGPSGCGKTTLLNITAGFLRPTSGKITLNKNEIDGPGVERGMVFQQGALFEWLTVAENVNLSLIHI